MKIHPWLETLVGVVAVCYISCSHSKPTAETALSSIIEESTHRPYSKTGCVDLLNGESSEPSLEIADNRFVFMKIQGDGCGAWVRCVQGKSSSGRKTKVKKYRILNCTKAWSSSRKQSGPIEKSSVPEKRQKSECDLKYPNCTYSITVPKPKASV